MSEGDPNSVRDLPPYHAVAVSRELAGRQQVSPRLHAERNVVIVAFGQSYNASYVNAPYTPASDRIENLSIVNGGLYQARDVMLGDNYDLLTRGSAMLRLGDKLIAQGRADRVILVPIAVGGSVASAWAPGGGLYSRIGVTASRLRAVGLQATALLCDLGVSDGIIGTPPDQFSATMTATYVAWYAAGVQVPIFQALSTFAIGLIAPPIRAAQAALVNNVSIFGGPDLDAIPSSQRYGVGHWTADGAAAAADLWIEKLAPFLH